MKVIKIRKNEVMGPYKRNLVRLYELSEEIPGNSKKSYIPYKKVWSKLCRNNSVSDIEILEYLKCYEEFGYIEFVKFKGIKLLYKVEIVE